MLTFEVKLTAEVWNSSLSNKSSESYAELGGKIEDDVSTLVLPLVLFQSSTCMGVSERNKNHE